jgi:DNA-binding NtrC family response regulator
MPNILIVDDEISMLKGIEYILQNVPGFKNFTAPNLDQAIEIMEKEDLDLVISELMLPKIEEGLEVIRKAKSHSYNPSLLIMTAFDTAENAIEAMKAGADDFISKGFSADELIVRINNILEKRRYLEKIAFENKILKDSLKQQYNDFKIVGQSKGTQDLIKKIKKIADDGNSTCLIHGESGTGKDLIARTIHLLSKRNLAPFVPINCAAIPDNLIESELFGHEKGAFTGAINTQHGKFEQATNGIIFLDEISELSKKMQVRLLRVLEERSFYRIGGKKLINIDVMVLAATNVDLFKMVKKNKFREDLYYRLNVINIYTPPLRERKEDIAELAIFFIEKLNQERNKNIKISKQALNILKDYSFRGNVRELRNIIEDAFVFCTENVIEPCNLTLIQNKYEIEADLNDNIANDNSPIYIDQPYHNSLVEFEKSYFEKLLRHNYWNLTKAAEKAQISREWLSKKIKSVGLKKKM